MWMVFISNGGSYLQSTCNAVHALNGEIVVGRSGAVRKWNYIDECAFSITISNTSKNKGNLSQRNSQSGWYQVSTNAIVGTPINDVAMTVLPTAPIDPDTGLQVPTIAVATNSGVSVFKDDGTVVNITGFSPTQKVEIDEKYVISTARTVGHDFIYKVKIPSVTSSFTSLISSGVGGGFYTNSGYTGDVAKPVLRNDNTRGLAYSPDNTIIMGGDLGLEIIAEETNINGYIINQSNAEAPIDYITTSYNTGYMHGDIKGAFLSDTTVESLTANANLASSATQAATARLTSETYTDGATSWQMVDNAGDDNGYLAISFGGLTVGQTYHLSMTVDANAALDAGYDHKLEQGTNLIYLNHWNGTGAGTLTTNFTAVSGTNALYFYANAITVNVTNFNIRAVDDEDRSLNNNGLAVYGTVTKSAVASGAELVAYSGWSSSNYLRQPYNSGLNAGTGDFHIMCWVKGNELMLWHRGGDGGNTDLRCEFPTSGGNTNKPRFYMYNGTSGSVISFYATQAFDTTTWHHCVWVKDSPTTGKLYIDGVLDSSGTASNGPVDITSTSANLTIGNRADSSGEPFNGSVALFRIGASAPSAEQVKKMYNDEKALFQENADCTLYGSSDAVTALAYDEKTNLLHVGTSSGRSDFIGLRRINNTTEAVTTAISAYDGSIAQQ